MSDPTSTLADLEAQIDQHDDGGDLVILATTIEHFGRQLAQELQLALSDPARAEPLKPILLRVPAVHVRALLRAAEKLDDAGNSRTAARVLAEALHSASDADRGEQGADALGFVLVAFEQRAASTTLETLLALDPALPRRERRQRHLELVDELADAIDWTALDDELS